MPLFVCLFVCGECDNYFAGVYILLETSDTAGKIVNFTKTCRTMTHGQWWHVHLRKRFVTKTYPDCFRCTKNICVRACVCTVQKTNCSAMTSRHTAAIWRDTWWVTPWTRWWRHVTLPLYDVTRDGWHPGPADDVRRFLRLQQHQLAVYARPLHVWDHAAAVRRHVRVLVRLLARHDVVRMHFAM